MGLIVAGLVGPLRYLGIVRAVRAGANPRSKPTIAMHAVVVSAGVCGVAVLASTAPRI